MIFFDNQTNNCHTVAGIGVTVVYTPDGVTRAAFQVGGRRSQSCLLDRGEGEVRVVFQVGGRRSQSCLSGRGKGKSELSFR